MDLLPLEKLPLERFLCTAAPHSTIEKPHSRHEVGKLGSSENTPPPQEEGDAIVKFLSFPNLCPGSKSRCLYLIWEGDCGVEVNAQGVSMGSENRKLAVGARVRDT